jgi:hypothetical protein
VTHTHRRLATRVERIEQADQVLADMRAGATLHLQHAKAGPQWALSNGRRVANDIAQLVIASASVVGVGDSLFNDAASQTWRWWRE